MVADPSKREFCGEQAEFTAKRANNYYIYATIVITPYYLA